MKEKIKFHYLVDERVYRLESNGKPLNEIIDEFIKIHDVDIPMLSESDYKVVWSHRTQVNALLDDITKARKQTTAVMINPLLDACKPLEKRLQETSDKLTEKLNAFKPKQPKPKTEIVLTISGLIGVDEEKLSKIEMLAKELNLEIVKEER